MTRAVLIQLALFLAIALVCAVFVANTVLGPQALTAPTRVTVRMADAAGLAPTSQVTYRGLRVGTVSDVRVSDNGDDVRVELALDPGARIPASSKAMVSMDTPMGIQHLDLQGAEANPPYLRSGSVIQPENTSRPLPLETLLVHFSDLAKSVDGRDIAVLSESLSTGLNGTEPELQRILNNTRTLTELVEQREPQITNLLDQGPSLLGSADGTAGDLPQLAASMRELTGDVRKQEPAVRKLADTAPGTTKELVRLLNDNQQATGVLLGNMVSTGQIVSARTPALRESLVAVPQGLEDLGSIVHGNIADFYLVGAQGPVCYYDTPRRTATDTGPRELRTEWTCPAGKGLQQRGADSAPRPGGPTSPSAVHNTAAPAPAAPITTYDPASKQIVGPPGQGFQLGSNGGQSSVLGPRSWYSIMLQGVR